MQILGLVRGGGREGGRGVEHLGWKLSLTPLNETVQVACSPSPPVSIFNAQLLEYQHTFHFDELLVSVASPPDWGLSLDNATAARTVHVSRQSCP